MRVWLLCGEGKVKHSPAVLLGFNPDSPAIALNQSLACCEADTGTGDI